MSLYPASFDQWIALITVASPLFLAGVGGFAKGVAALKAERASRWARLQTLLGTLYNYQGEAGLWRQIAAIDEIAEMRRPRETIWRIATNAAHHFGAISEPSASTLTAHIERKLKVSRNPLGRPIREHRHE